MKLKKLLFEGRTRKISKSMFLELYNENVGIKPYKLPSIFRGMDSDLKYGFIEPAKFHRKSAYTDNYYTLIIDNSENWRKYPKRSKSVVCSTSKDRAGFYGKGEFYHVFPVLGAEIAMCPGRDIWESFSYLEKRTGIRDLGKFNRVLNYLAEMCLGKEELSESWPELKNELDKIGECETFSDIYQKGGFESVNYNFPKPEEARIIEIANHFFMNYTSFYEMITDLLDPNENGFEIKKFKGGDFQTGVEVWTSDPCLLVHDDFFPEELA